MKNQLLIGWSEVNITPEKKIKLAGQFFERISEYTETPITVTAMAVECGAEQMVICSCDLVGVKGKLLEAVRARLCDVDGLRPESVIIGATHTHTSFLYNIGNTKLVSSLDVLKRFLPDGKKYVELVDESSDIMKNDEIAELLVSRIAAAVKDAWVSRKSALYANAFGRAAVGMCRRVCYDDGSAKMWGDVNLASFTELEGGNDNGIELLYTFDDTKKLTGIVANIACPSQVVEHRSFISSDYWGKVRILLREKFGNDIKLLCLCAPAGDQCPRDLIRWVNPEMPIDDPNIERKDYIERTADPSMFDIKGTWTIGRRVASEIIAVYGELSEYKSDALLEHRTMSVDLPVRRVTISEYETAKREIAEFMKECGNSISFADNAAMHVHAGTIARYEFQQKHELHTIELHIARLGEVAFATSPFELFLDYGNLIRARSRARQTFLIQLCCGSDGYLPTEKAERGSHYSAYVSSGIVGHAGGEALVRKSLSEINDMFA